ncbi:RimK family alpha-L-glutamate ligase [Hyphomicrobium sp.]|jgi:RimK family alpha-L-glutamate ligase|uniref:ATP-grasp domain-containing protein n=1 Tax=Hyphomicrobium sp. TaxID=82 RepID=UPI002BDB84AF|nr:RimK family alpha-L-glutamate ligase [Hyphomicrobium sp.]HVZ03698.1 RimK family alpha-L-glutamate ligase [Hyphomicrobium sp.]
MRASAEAHAKPLLGHGAGLHFALLIEEGRGEWHARRIVRSLEEMGARVTVSSLPHCAFDTGLPSGIDIPGFDGALPDGVFVRSISAGTLEQITFRLGLLHALRESGVRVWNDARAIERCVDKSQTTFLLHKNGIPTPRTRVCETLQHAQEYTDGLDRPLVMKPLFGSQGKGIGMISSASELPAAETVDEMYYMQDYVAPKDGIFEDWRVLATRHRVIAAMIRRGTSWVTNIHQGGKAKAHLPDDEMIAVSMAAMRAVDADYAGIDLIRAADGKLQVLEVNSNPAWRGLQGVADVNIAWAIAEDFLRTVIAHRASLGVGAPVALVS